MPSFDIVSEVDPQELKNAVSQANREIQNRFDFRGIEAGFILEDNGVVVFAPEEFQLQQLVDILKDKLVRRKIDVRALTAGDIQGAGKLKRQIHTLVQGVDKETSRDIVKLIKSSKLKVQASIQGEKVRVSGKKRDDLQSIMALLKESSIDIPLQFDNFRD